MWLTEDPWPPMIIFIMIGLGLAFVASSQQKPRLYVAAAFMGILCGLSYLIDRVVVTEGEKLTAAIHDMADAFHRNDRAGFLNYVSPRNVDLQNTANAALDLVDIEDDYRITDVDVETAADRTLAQTHFRVNVTATVLGVGSDVRQPTRWILKWRKEGDKWRIIEVQRLDPLSGRKMPPLSLSN